eukprot:759270-Prymnesium_polylepis.1
MESTPMPVQAVAAAVAAIQEAQRAARRLRRRTKMARSAAVHLGEYVAQPLRRWLRRDRRALHTGEHVVIAGHISTHDAVRVLCEAQVVLGRREEAGQVAVHHVQGHLAVLGPQASRGAVAPQILRAPHK